MGQRRDDARAAERADDSKKLWSDVADRTSGLRMKRRINVDADDLIGGHYRLLESVGDSAYGRAFRAEQIALGREVAVHFIPEGLVSERTLSRDLPLAVAKCAQLAHPNVVSLHAYGRSDDTSGMYYVVTDPLEGIPLSDYLHNRGPLSLREALSFVRQIGRALRAAHKLGIVHGDLRPANVRVVAIDEQPMLKVVGFGKLPLMSNGADVTTHVRGIAAPTYAAPELLSGQPVDARTDVYALGAIMFRMIAGVAPFSGMTPAAVLDAMRARERPSLRGLMGDAISPEIDALVSRCLALSPTDRFADIVTMMRAMRLSAIDEGDLLSREVSDVSSPPSAPGARSILPSVSSADVTGARQALAMRDGNQERTRFVIITIAVVLVLGVLGEVLLSSHVKTGVRSEPILAPNK